jgi:hypothetical protein
MQQWMMKAEEAGIQYMIMGQITEGAGLIIGALMIYHELTLSLPPPLYEPPLGFATLLNFFLHQVLLPTP